ncbi:MAG: hypothetical protein K2O18_07555 [Oscillospiraceae bacterium]|nr:hypothetical protein [Oscillospiraceae bacterium]
MRNIFLLNADFRKSLQNEYSFLKLKMILQDESDDSTRAEYAIKKAREQCKEIFPSFRQIKFRNISATDKFQYLKFLYYVIRKNFECEKNGFSLFPCIKKPSERYLSLYTNVMSEIKQNVTDTVRLEIEKQHPSKINDESQQNKQKQAYYADSIHTIQQYIELIALCLFPSYIGKPYNELQRDEEYFYTCCELKTNDAQKVKSWTVPLTFWDELYVYLAHARDFYWELDLLSAYQKIADATVISPSPKQKYYNTRFHLLIN